MRLYYFKGNLVDGLNFTSLLEDISIKRQKKRFGKVLINPNMLNVEGECEYRIYYLRKYSIKLCKKSSIKGLLIRILGKEIKIRVKHFLMRVS